MGSHGVRDKVAIVGMGCTNFAELWDKGLDDLIVDASTEAFASAGVSQGGRRRLLVRHGAERDERHHAGPAAAAPQQAGHPGRELLHHRLRGAARRGLRRGVGRLRRGHGGRRREGEGQRVPGSQRHEPAGRRDRAHPDGGGDVLHGGAGLRAEVRGGRRDHGRRAGLHRGEEPPQRRAQPTGPVPTRDHQGGRAQLPTPGRHPRRLRLRRSRRRRGRRHRRAGRGRARYTDTAHLHQGACRSRRGAARVSSILATTTPTSPSARPPRPTPTRRPASPTRGGSSPWPRCTTASRRRSSC